MNTTVLAQANAGPGAAEEIPNPSAGTGCTFVTFYSFKGGVGRTRALANAAYELVHRGFDVLCVDFDLEAPDLSTYLGPWMPRSEQSAEDGLRLAGVVELISAYQQYMVTRNPTVEPPHWRRYVHTLEIVAEPRRRSLEAPVGKLDLIPAGSQDESYPGRVAALDWTAFYERLEGGRFVEYLRGELARNYDFVLIDSRTGYADIAGICTIQLPDLLVPLFTTSRASLGRLQGVVESALRGHDRMPRDRPLRVIPLPVRVDNVSVKAEEREAWLEWVCQQRVGDWIREVAPATSAETTFQQIMLYYQPQYTYRSELECHVADRTGQDEVNASQYARLIDLLCTTSRIPMIRQPRDDAAVESLVLSVDTAVLWANPTARHLFEDVQPISSPGPQPEAPGSFYSSVLEEGSGAARALLR